MEKTDKETIKELKKKIAALEAEIARLERWGNPAIGTTLDGKPLTPIIIKERKNDR